MLRSSASSLPLQTRLKLDHQTSAHSLLASTNIKTHCKRLHKLPLRRSAPCTASVNLRPPSPRSADVRSSLNRAPKSPPPRLPAPRPELSSPTEMPVLPEMLAPTSPAQITPIESVASDAAPTTHYQYQTGDRWNDPAADVSKEFPTRTAWVTLPDLLTPTIGSLKARHL